MIQTTRQQTLRLCCNSFTAIKQFQTFLQPPRHASSILKARSYGGHWRKWGNTAKVSPLASQGLFWFQTRQCGTATVCPTSVRLAPCLFILPSFVFFLCVCLGGWGGQYVDFDICRFQDKERLRRMSRLLVVRQKICTLYTLPIQFHEKWRLNWSLAFGESSRTNISTLYLTASVREDRLVFAIRS